MIGQPSPEQEYIITEDRVNKIYLMLRDGHRPLPIELQKIMDVLRSRPVQSEQEIREKVLDELENWQILRRGHHFVIYDEDFKAMIKELRGKQGGEP